MKKCDKMAGRRQTLRPEFVQNREIQQFFGKIFVQFAYRHSPVIIVYYNQVKRERERERNYKNLRNNVLGIGETFDKYERNNDIWALILLWNVINDIQPFCSVIEFVDEMKGNGFDLKINIKEGEKGKVFCYILKLKSNQSHKISEISIGLKSLEMIFSDSKIN